MRRCARSTNTTNAVVPSTRMMQQQRKRTRHLAGVHRLGGVADGARQARDDARQDDHRDAVADAALGDLLAEPHQEQRAGRHGDRGREQKLPAA